VQERQRRAREAVKEEQQTKEPQRVAAQERQRRKREEAAARQKAEAQRREKSASQPAPKTTTPASTLPSPAIGTLARAESKSALSREQPCQAFERDVVPALPYGRFGPSANTQRRDAGCKERYSHRDPIGAR
jgi:hypothetical protein